MAWQMASTCGIAPNMVRRRGNRPGECNAECVAARVRTANPKTEYGTVTRAIANERKVFFEFGNHGGGRVRQKMRKEVDGG